MKTGDIITPTHAIFKEGKLWVIQLPEPLTYPCIVCQTMDCDARSCTEHHEEACTYAREHPIEVQEKDKEKVRELIWDFNIGVPDYQIWEHVDLTEYRVEGLKFEIKNQRKVIRDYHEGGIWVDTNILNFAESEYRQLACLIEGDEDYSHPLTMGQIVEQETEKEHLTEMIAKVHDCAEGRYELTGDDLYEIQHLLCKLQ